jgi:P4 family phage/plasmid primase-like protien
MKTNQDFNYEPDKLAEKFLGEYYIWHPEDDSPPEHYRDGKRAEWKLRWWRGEFYDWHNGRYTRVGDKDLSALVAGFLQDSNRPKFAYDPPDPAIKITTALVNNILLNMTGIEGVYISDRRELNSWPADEKSASTSAEPMTETITISFLNGLLMFSPDTSDGPVFISHTPRYFSLARLPYNYDKDASCPRWQAFLDDVMEGDWERTELLQEWAGYLLANTLKFQKFMLLAGEGGNGKTVFTTIMEKMVGEENASHVPLSNFDKPFGLSSTLGKMLNTSSESSHRIDELCETALKSYTSGDRMTFDRKFREPISCNPTAKVMISTNQLPNFTDKSNGVWRRMLFVPFDKCVPIDEQNPELVKELAAELPGIFNWAIAGLRKLMADGRFIEPKKCKEAIGEYRRDTNPAKVFLEENYVEGFEFDGIPCGEMYQAYAAWCNQNGYRPLNASHFGKEVKRAFPNVEKIREQVKGERTQVYKSLAVQEGSQVSRSQFHGCY